MALKTRELLLQANENHRATFGRALSNEGVAVVVRVGEFETESTQSLELDSLQCYCSAAEYRSIFDAIWSI